MRKFWIALIGLCFISGLLLAQRTPEENFQKAARAELVWREGNLSLMKVDVEEFFVGMGNDKIISGEEMRILKKMVEDFHKTRKRYDKKLEFYEVKTTTDIKPVIREHLEIYFKDQESDPDRFYYRDNKNQDIRRYHVEQTGYDITVEESKWYWPYYIVLAIFWGVVIAAIFGMILWLAFNDKKVAWTVAFIAFVCGFFLVI